ncbi:MAG TPA: TAT-variant-translocated molybdopterin oxidoreductase [Candidatus Paceibacterota bacterium]|nr:TAT-variant-translocated molybdopterin oxidoreductase [Verrucomicrobiota bacterium]HRY49662.1 TAT-variant-translocated molybdopterin oxidoreductase [Candidatus Paceibacterota bacterium]
MNSLSRTCLEPPWNRRYWRSPEELSDTPEFRDWVEREFPESASELRDPVTRRYFIRIMSASFLLAGIGLTGTGCRRPEETILPFGKMPEGYAHGVPQYYATAMPMRDYAVPLLVKSYDGRPIKIEGNPQHPTSRGGTDPFAQASILDLYDPDRSTRFLQKGGPVDRAAAVRFLEAQARAAAGREGAGVAFLVTQSSSPSRERLRRLILARWPKAEWHEDEAVDLRAGVDATGTAFGRPLKPDYHFEKSSRILALDADLLGSEPDACWSIQRFVQGRRLVRRQDDINRLYAVESLMTLTGAAADHRLRASPGMITAVACGLSLEFLRLSQISHPATEALKRGAGPAQGYQRWIEACAADLWEHRGRSLVLAGHRQPQAVHLLAYWANHLLGNIGSTLILRDAPRTVVPGLAELAETLNAGRIETLFIVGGNPVYSAPAELDWKTVQRKAKTVVRLGYWEDETSTLADWHFPAAHYLETWGDVRSGDGTLTSIQPLIAPLFGGMGELEFLAHAGGLPETNPYAIVRETFQQITGVPGIDSAWSEYLHDGFLKKSESPVIDAPFQTVAMGDLLSRLLADSGGSGKAGGVEVVFCRDYRLDDGRYNNNGWLQEMPDPITKLTWENAILLSRTTAASNGLRNFDLIEVELAGRKIEGPVWIQAGMADGTLGLALGYGRQVTGRVGTNSGYNAYQLRTRNQPFLAVDAKIRKTGSLADASYRIGCTQNHGAMEGRPIIREANLKQFRQQPDFARNRMGLEAHAPNAGPIYAHPPLTGLHQWGMAIDLNACVGCSACVMACQSENNIPIVGREQVSRGREMHWIRVDRYYAGDPERPAGEQMDDPQVVYQPMFCQHCENAPCENVCPVNATVHDEEGLNVMAYNRCVGTRYCSNNCPYKVRRFNFFDYNKRPIGHLYRGPLARRPDEELDLIRLIKNPDVTVRMRGVMEKCTYCVQRIEQAKIARKIKAGASDAVRVPDGTITPACAQACPAEAIVFGDISDPQSRVSQLKALERNYSVLGFLDVKPRTTYLARVRNPNPAMPDYREAPLSLEEYSRRHGDPFAHGVMSEGAGHGPAAGEERKGAH